MIRTKGIGALATHITDLGVRARFLRAVDEHATAARAEVGLRKDRSAARSLHGSRQIIPSSLGPLRTASGIPVQRNVRAGFFGQSDPQLARSVNELNGGLVHGISGSSVLSSVIRNGLPFPHDRTVFARDIAASPAVKGQSGAQQALSIILMHAGLGPEQINSIIYQPLHVDAPELLQLAGTTREWHTILSEKINNHIDRLIQDLKVQSGKGNVVPFDFDSKFQMSRADLDSKHKFLEKAGPRVFISYLQKLIADSGKMTVEEVVKLNDIMRERFEALNLLAELDKVVTNEQFDAIAKALLNIGGMKKIPPFDRSTLSSFEVFDGRYRGAYILAGLSINRNAVA